MRKLLLLLISLLLSITGCSQITGEDEPDEPPTLSRELTATEKQLVEADRTFSYDIFRRTVNQESADNIFISPLSVSMALGMTLNGASGETKSAMQQTLNLQGMDLQEINESYSTLIKLLQSADPKVKMELANSVWARQGFEVDEEFIERCKEFFEARIESLDFSDPSAPEQINQWVRENTGGLIDTIIDDGIPPEMVLFLINAIYFDADWQYQFDPDETENREFTTEEGAIEAEMMSQKHELAGYVSDEVQLLDLPYGDSLFTMTLMMPADEETAVDDFIEEELTAENVDHWISEMSVETTQIAIPKFKMGYNITMNGLLKEMGMDIAFDKEQADFANINKDKQLFISQVKHKSFIEVDEEGTEAAAVTSVGLGVTSAGPQIRTIEFDRPFVFMIRERTSNTILFMGKVGDPL